MLLKFIQNLSTKMCKSGFHSVLRIEVILYTSAGRWDGGGEPVCRFPAEPRAGGIVSTCQKYGLTL